MQKYQDKLTAKYLENTVNKNNEIRKGKNKVVRNSVALSSVKFLGLGLLTCLSCLCAFP